MSGHITAVVVAVAGGLLAEFAFGDGFRWLPSSSVAWLVALGAFALGEGFLHWLVRQARRVAEEDVLFRGIATPAPESYDDDVQGKNMWRRPSPGRNDKFITRAG